MLAERICVMVPFRGVQNSKQRLSPFLNTVEREQLVFAMLCDTLTALQCSQLSSDVVLLTNDTSLSALAVDYSLCIIKENVAATDLNSAVQMACEELGKQYDAVLVVHADIPMLSAEDVNTMVSEFKKIDSQHRLLISPDASKFGSNCLLLSLLTPFRFQYGARSFKKHLEFAQENNIQSCVIERKNIGIDIDEAEDLAHFLQASCFLKASSAAEGLKDVLGSNTLSLLQQWNIPARLDALFVYSDN